MKDIAQKLREFLESSGLSYDSTQRSYIFRCPKCNKADKLYIEKTTGKFVCWVCADEGFRGAPEFALSAMTGQPVHEIRDLLYSYKRVAASKFLDINITDFFGESEEEQEVVESWTEPEAYEVPVNWYPLEHRFSTEGVKYLAGRGVTKEVADAYGVQYCPPQRSIIFPAWVGGKLMGWQTRVIDPDQKIKAKTEGEKANFWLFQDRIIDHAVVCEGPIDALKCHLSGGNVSALGKAVSQAQVKILLNSGIKSVYLALDPDAYASIDPLVRKLDGVEVHRVQIPDDKDIGDCSLEEAKELIESAPVVIPGQVHVWLKNFGF